MPAATRFLAATVALVPLLAAAGDARPSRVHLTATPDTIRLAEGTRAQVRIATPGAVPTLTASVGRVEGLREIASGLYEAD
jgi:hypothetical protein